jgi:hypothetical protein
MSTPSPPASALASVGALIEVRKATDRAYDRPVESFDRDVRRHVYFSIVALGRPPAAAEAAAALGCPESRVVQSYRRLHDAHALGIPGALHGDGAVRSACACCGE